MPISDPLRLGFSSRARLVPQHKTSVTEFQARSASATSVPRCQYFTTSFYFPFSPWWCQRPPTGSVTLPSMKIQTVFSRDQAQELLALR